MSRGTRPTRRRIRRGNVAATRRNIVTVSNEFFHPERTESLEICASITDPATGGRGAGAGRTMPPPSEHRFRIIYSSTQRKTANGGRGPSLRCKLFMARQCIFFGTPVFRSVIGEIELFRMAFSSYCCKKCDILNTVYFVCIALRAISESGIRFC